MYIPHLSRPRCPPRALLSLVLLLFTFAPAAAQERVLDDRSHFLRMGTRAEWSESAIHPHASAVSIDFTARPNAAEQTLSLEQRDVKQRWRVLLNGQPLGMLHQDENAMVVYWPVPAGSLVRGKNTLRVEPADTLVDDIRIGRVVLGEQPLRRTLSAAWVEVEVVDADLGTPLPTRITITDPEGRLRTVSADSSARVAARPGFIYSGDGRASIGLPAGSYRIYAGRGFEYGVDSTDVVVRPGDRLSRTLHIRHEVPTPGWISTDTHIHTLTHSGHGDATIEERALSIAGEGIEMPILTDHNVHVNLEPAAAEMGVRSFFTPVIGNEVTTPVGHFNVFPVAVETPAPEARVGDWVTAFEGIRGTPGVEAIILNHGRDVHSGFRPFGPERHIAVAGMNLDGWTLRANAMEVVNSGALQSDVMRLYGDWFGMLNRGHHLTPVGSSDSHDVGRYLVGQARTYVRSSDDDPGRIAVAEAVESFLAGAVMVSFGLLAEITVDGTYGPGDLAPASDEVAVEVRVSGPGWTRADRVSLYANGRRIRTLEIPHGDRPGEKWSGTWRLPRPAHDVFLVAIAEGPGEHRAFWPIVKPYQPTSPDWTPRVIGSSGAVWIDADGDGRRTAARTYAVRLMASSDQDIAAFVASLAGYDESVAVQAAALLLENGVAPTRPDVTAALAGADVATRRGFEAFIRDWHASQAARSVVTR
jgi:hypothetical protein